MKKFLIAALIAGISTSIFADDIKTREQSNHEVMAGVAGSTMRILKGDKSECGSQYQGEERVACEKGFDAQDKILNQPVSNQSK